MKKELELILEGLSEGIDFLNAGDIERGLYTLSMLKRMLQISIQIEAAVEGGNTDLLNKLNEVLNRK